MQLPRSDPPLRRRIAVEEAWSPVTLLKRYMSELDKPGVDPGFATVCGSFLRGQSERSTFIRNRLTDLGPGRLADMEERGITTQILSLISPGVQIFAPQEGHRLAVDANDELADATRTHAGSLYGLAAVMPLLPDEGASEMERAKRLGLRGVIINSHTQGQYLDAQFFWPLFEAAEHLDLPIYLHPTTPPEPMVSSLLSRGLEGGIFGFAAETSLHVLRMLVGGVFDRFPRLQLVLGHAGEGLPYFMHRIDRMHAVLVASKRCHGAPILQRSPRDVLLQNFHYTTSGMSWQPVVKFMHEVLGPDRLMYAMDYPLEADIASVRDIEALSFSEIHKDKLFWRNAARVFQLRESELA